MTAPKTLVIVPAFNEEAALPSTLADLEQSVPDCDVLVVDDGSTDQTAEVARRAGVRVAVLPFNLGVGGAVRTGLRFAARNGYARAIQFDGDGQHQAAEIPKLIRALDQGADLVIGSRFATGENDYRIGRVRAGAMGLLRLLARLMSGMRFTDTTSGFRAFSRPLIDFFPDTYPIDYLSDTAEALLLAAYAGFEIVEVPVKMRYRSEGRPSARKLALMYHYLRLLFVIAVTAPMRRRRNRK